MPVIGRRKFNTAKQREEGFAATQDFELKRQIFTSGLELSVPGFPNQHPNAHPDAGHIPEDDDTKRGGFGFSKSVHTGPSIDGVVTRASKTFHGFAEGRVKLRVRELDNSQ